jgi:predicted MFS family arabinose efflux permease
MHYELRSTQAWLALGAAALLLCALVWRSFDPGRASAMPPTASAAGHSWSAEHIRLVIAYGLFGFGYILPATFLPVMAKQAIGNPALFGWSWPLFGLAAAASTFLLAILPRSVDLRRAWVSAQVVMAIGVALPVVWTGIAAIVVSALSVGGTFMVITAAAMQEARKVAPQHAPALIALMTSAFALGQIAGPLAVSGMAGARGDFAMALSTAAVLLLLGAGLIVRFRHDAGTYPLPAPRTKDTS